MPLQYVEGRCDVCGDEIGNHEPFAITNLGLIVCKACGDKNQDMIFKWFDTTQTALDLIIEEHGKPEEDKTVDDPQPQEDKPSEEEPDVQ